MEKNTAIRKITALVLCLAIVMIPFVSLSASAEEEKEYEYSSMNGFSAFSRIALAMLYRTGSRTIGTSKAVMPNGTADAVKITVASVEGSNSFSLATCAVDDQGGGFVSDAHSIPVASGTAMTPFTGRDGEDSDGIKMYIGTGTDKAVTNAAGTVKVQFGTASSKGTSKEAKYESLDRGFVFESEECTIGADGYAYIGYESIRCVDGWTEKGADFYNDYLPLVDALNIIVTPSATMATGDLYYISDVRFFREKQTYGINLSAGQAVSGTRQIKIRTAGEGDMQLKFDGGNMPPYCEVKEYADTYGYRVKSYTVDTLLAGDGQHSISFMIAGTEVNAMDIFFDNSMPYLASSSIKDGSTVPLTGRLEMTAGDLVSGVASFDVTLDAEPVTVPKRYSFSGEGNHVIRYTITDNAGNVTKGSIHFTVGNESITSAASTVSGRSANLGIKTQNVSSTAKAQFYTVDGALDVTAYSNVTGMENLTGKTPAGEQANASVTNISASSRDDKYPYVAYEVDVSGVTGDSFRVSFSGAANTGEKLVLSVFNETQQKWEELDRETFVTDSLVLDAYVPVADHTADGKAKFRISLLSVDNGSDTFAWCTDAQHMIRRIWEDGNPREYGFYVKEQFEQFLSDYRNGIINYVANTGDIVDQNTVESQWIEAREYSDILDSNNVPNGVTPGNHDTRWTSWAQYYGPQYYQNQDWYGEYYDTNNSCHYDLVTIGGRDYIFLHIGWSMEQKSAVHSWAQSVLSRYSDRDCILCTHGYLNIDNTHNVNYMNDTEALWRGVVNKCPNVVMVICGHEPGVAHTTSITDDGREVVEILHDYQSDSPANRWWIWNEGGWGLFRYVTIKDGKVINRTYTASQDHYSKDYYWDHDQENFEMDITVGTNNRFVKGFSFAAFTGTGTSVGRISQVSGAYTCEVADTNGAKLWYAMVNGKATAVMPIGSSSADAPVITAAAGVDGKVSVQWNGSDAATGYTVFVDGQAVGTADAGTTSFEYQTEKKTGEKCRIAVSADNADGSVMSLAAETVMAGAGDVVKGDADGNGEVAVTDALTVLRVSVGCGTITYDGFVAGDINKDRKLTVYDAMATLRIAAGLAA